MYLFSPEMDHRVPLDKDEGCVKTKRAVAVREHRSSSQRVEDQSSGRLTLHHHAEWVRPHQPSIRP